MARTITQRIALEGGKDIRKQLEELGTAGALAFRKLQDAAKATSGIGSQIAKNLREAAKAAQTLGRDFDKLEKSIQKFGKNLIFAVGAVTGAVFGIGKLGAEIARLTGQEHVITALSNQFTNLRTRIAQAFAPLVREGASAVSSFLRTNEAAILRFSNVVAQKLRPVMDDLFAALEGRDADVQNTVILQARDAIVSFATGVKIAIFDIIVPAFNALRAVLTGVANVLNSAFGTKFNADSIIAVAIVVKLTGGLKVLTTAVTVLRTAFLALSAAFGVSPLGRLLIIVGALAGAIIALTASNAGLVKSFREGWTAVVETVSAAYESIVGFFIRLVDQVVGIWNKISETVLGTWNAITAGAQGAVDFVVKLFTDAFSFLTSGFQKVYDFVAGVFKKIIDGAKAVASAVSGAASSAGAASGGEVRAAGGGFVRGPGSSTSDSIAARLSDGEFVQRAKAARYYGVDFMHALNQLRIPADAARLLMRGFSMGGLVDAFNTSFDVPRLADGGLVTAGAGGGRAVNIHFPGLGPMPATMTDNTIETIDRYARGKAIKSSGRKPRWYT